MLDNKLFTLSSISLNLLVFDDLYQNITSHSFNIIIITWCVNRSLLSSVGSVVIIKRGPVIEAEKNLSSQLRLMNLSDGSPYETLHSIVSNAVAPYFKSFLRVTGKADR